MIFFLFGRPSALFMYQTSFIWLSLASEPELQKNTFEIGTGAISFSFSASSIAGIVALGGEQMRERAACASAWRRPRPVLRCRSRAPCTTGPAMPSR